MVSKNDMKIYESKVIGKGQKIVNILFHKTFKNKRTFYHYYWIKNINNIKSTIKNAMSVFFATISLALVMR